MTEWWRYDELPSGEPYDWGGTVRGSKPWDNEDFHLDLGCGRVKKARLGIDHKYSPGVNLLVDLEQLGPPDTMAYIEDNDTREGVGETIQRTYETFDAEGIRRDDSQELQHGTTTPFGFLPFPDGSIKSVISHHALEHVRNLMPLMDEVHRILEPGGLFRIVVPAFPSHAAVADPTHVRYFCEGTWHTWIGAPGSPKYTEGFAEDYATATFINEEIDVSPLPYIPGTPGLVDYERLMGPEGAREFRVAFRKHE